MHLSLTIHYLRQGLIFDAYRVYLTISSALPEYIMKHYNKEWKNVVGSNKPFRKLRGFFYGTHAYRSAAADKPIMVRRGAYCTIPIAIGTGKSKKKDEVFIVLTMLV